MDILIQGWSRTCHCGWFHGLSMLCLVVVLTYWGIVHQPHVGWLDPLAWPLAWHWGLFWGWVAASNAAASWSKHARKVLLVCFILFTCSVSWEIDVACNAVVGESFWLFIACFPSFVADGYFHVFWYQGQIWWLTQCRQVTPSSPLLGPFSVSEMLDLVLVFCLPNRDCCHLPLPPPTSCRWYFLCILQLGPSRHPLPLLVLLVWTILWCSLSGHCAVQISIVDKGAYLQLLLLHVTWPISVP